MQNQSMMEKGASKQTAVSRWGGLSLMGLGGVVLLLSVARISLENWWALFILMPALAMAGIGWVWPRGENGRFSFISRLFFGAGLIVAVVAGMFMLNMNWSVWWPLMIATPSVALVLAAGKSDENPTTSAWVGFARWLSGSMLGLSAVFLAHTLGAIELASFGAFHWWGVFIAFPAMGALLQAVRLYGRLGVPSLSVITLLGIAFFGGITAVIELLDIPWTSYMSITAVFFIGSGILLIWHGLRNTSE